MKIVLTIFLFVFAVIGVSDVLHNAKLWFLKPKKTNAFVIVPIKYDESEMALSYLIEKIRWNNANYNKYIIAVNNSHGNPRSNKSYELAKRHGIRIINSYEFEELLSSRSTGWNKL